MNSGDVREWIRPNANWRGSLRGGRGGSGDAHPGSNFVGGKRWTAEEADQKIEETIAYHRERNIGFQWWVIAVRHAGRSARAPGTARPGAGR